MTIVDPAINKFSFSNFTEKHHCQKLPHLLPPCTLEVALKPIQMFLLRWNLWRTLWIAPKVLETGHMDPWERMSNAFKRKQNVKGVWGTGEGRVAPSGVKQLKNFEGKTKGLQFINFWNGVCIVPGCSYFTNSEMWNEFLGQKKGEISRKANMHFLKRLSKLKVSYVLEKSIIIGAETCDRCQFQTNSPAISQEVVNRENISQNTKHTSPSQWLNLERNQITCDMVHCLFSAWFGLYQNSVNPVYFPAFGLLVFVPKPDWVLHYPNQIALRILQCSIFPFWILYKARTGFN